MIRTISFSVKQKRVLIGALLLFVFFGALAPSAVLAQQQDSLQGFFQGFWGVTGLLNVGSVGSSIGNVASGFGKALIGIIFLVPYVLTTVVLVIIEIIFKVVISVSVDYISYTSLDPAKSIAVSVGWPIVRNFANIIVVVVLVTIALATILRIREYEAKKLLLPLLIAALLINFSLLICGVIIDVSNIATISFLKSGQLKAGLFGTLFSEITVAVNLISSVIDPNIDLANIFAQAMGKVFYNVAAIFVLVLFTLIFLFRIVALVVLVILAPIAFVCHAFPSTQNIWNMWRSNFLNWCIIGIPMAFFLFLGKNMLNDLDFLSLTNEAQGLLTVGGVGTSELEKSLISSLSKFIGLMIPGMFLVIGFIISIQISAMGSQIAVNAAGKVNGWIGGKLKGANAAVWSKIGDKTGFTKWAETVKTRAGQLREGLPFGPARGTAIAQKKAKQEEMLKRARETAKYVPLEEREKEVLRGESLDPEVNARRAAYAEEMKKDGTFMSLTAKQRREVAENAIDAGSSAEIFTSADADLADLDKDKMAALKAKYKRGAAETPDQYEERIKRMARIDAFGRMDTKEIKEKNDTDLIRLAEEGTAEGLTAERAKALEEAVNRGIIHKVKGGNIVEIGELLAKAKSDYGSNAIKSVKKTDWRYAEFDKEAVDEIMTKVNPVTGVNYTEPEAKKQAKINEIRKLNARKIREDIPASAINMELIENIDIETIKKLDQEGGLSREKKNALRRTLSGLIIKRNTMTRGSQKRKTLNAKIKKIKAMI